MKHTDKIKEVARHWSDLLGWTPIAIVVSLVLWAALAQYVSGGTQLVSLLVELAFLSTYLFVAIGVTRLVWRSTRVRLSEAQVAAYWESLVTHRLGPPLIFVTSMVFVLCTYAITLWFIWPSR